MSHPDRIRSMEIPFKQTTCVGELQISICFIKYSIDHHLFGPKLFSRPKQFISTVQLYFVSTQATGLRNSDQWWDTSITGIIYLNHKYTNPARGILDFCKQKFYLPLLFSQWTLYLMLWSRDIAQYSPTLRNTLRTLRNTHSMLRNTILTLCNTLKDISQHA